MSEPIRTIHLVGAQESNAPWGVECRIIRALKSLGHRVISTDFRKNRDNLTARLRIPADLVLVCRGDGIPPEMIENLSCPTALWYAELLGTRTSCDQAARLRRQQLAANCCAFDYCFTHDATSIEVCRDLGARNVRWLATAAVDETLNKRLDLPTRYDVVFVGTETGRRQRILDAIRSRFEVYSPQMWDMHELNGLYNSARIVLNLHLSDLLNTETRLCEVLGAGAFLLSEALSMDDFLIDGTHLASFAHNRPEDCIDKIGHYLSHPEERRRIADQGYDFVHRRHTFRHRMQSMLAQIDFQQHKHLWPGYALGVPRDSDGRPTLVLERFYETVDKNLARILSGTLRHQPQAQPVPSQSLLDTRRHWQSVRENAGQPAYGYPASYQIEPTTLCNLRCRMCSQSHWDQTQLERGHMSLAVFKQIVAQIPNPNSFLLFQGLGEPFLNPEYPDMVRHAADLGFQIMTATNGLLLNDEELCRRVISSGIGVLVYSIDSFDRNIYRSIRGADLDKVLDNVRLMVAVRNRTGRRIPRLQVNVVGMPDTIPGLPELVATAGSIGIDTVKMQEEGTETPNLDSCMTSGAAQRILAEAQRVARQYNVALHLNPKIVEPVCRAVGQLCYISWQGYVTPCCGNFTGSNPKWFNFGSVLENSLAELWFGAKYQKFYRRLSAQRPPKECLQCPIGQKMIACRPKTAAA